MKITIASDHAGIDLKAEVVKRLKAQHEIEDLGPFTTDSVDYPDFAQKVASSVSNTQADAGILICGTGIGMSIVANKFPGVRAALVRDLFSAEVTRKHNDANVLCLGARVTDEKLALQIVDQFFSTEFEGGRHQKRVEKIQALEKKETT